MFCGDKTFFTRCWDISSWYFLTRSQLFYSWVFLMRPQDNFQLCLWRPKLDIFDGKSGHLQRFVVTKPDVFNKTSGEISSCVCGDQHWTFWTRTRDISSLCLWWQKSDVFWRKIKTSPAAFVVTKLCVFNKTTGEISSHVCGHFWQEVGAIFSCFLWRSILDVFHGKSGHLQLCLWC